MRYQQERDNFMINLSNKLRPVYDDAERGYQFLKGIEAMEQQLGTAKPTQVEATAPISNNVPVQPKKADTPKKKI
jgi:hypothetical protein